MPATLSLITTIFPPEERTKAIATWTGFAGAGAAVGPIMSGFLLEHFWWGATVLINLPVVALTAGAIYFLSPKSKESHLTRMDPVGAVLSITGMISLLYGIIEGGSRGWTDPFVLAGFASAVVFLSAFIAWERRVEHPMLPVSLFADRRLSVGSGVITLGFFCAFGLFFLSTLYMQYVLGYSTLTTGLATLPWAVAIVIVAPRSAALGEKLGSGRVIAGGFAIIAVAFGLLTTLDVNSPYILLGAAFALMGAGMGCVFAPATGNIMAAVPLDKAGVGSAVNDTTRELGAALGVAVLGTVIGSIYRSGLDLSSSNLTTAQADEAKESIGGAVHVAGSLPDGGGALLTQAHEAFVDAFRVTNAISMAITIAVGAVVLATLRRDKPAPNSADAVDVDVDEIDLTTVPVELDPAVLAATDAVAR